MKKIKPNKVISKTAKIASETNLSIKEKMRRIIEEKDTIAGRWFDISIQVLIIFSLIVYSLSTLPNLAPFWRKVLNILDISCYIIFTVEYLARIYITEKKLKYIFSFYGIIDLIAILPFLLASEVDLRSIRALRVFRIISALHISRYNESLVRFSLALKIIRPELVLFFIVTNVFLFLAAAGIYFFEKDVQPQAFASIFHSLWWAIITLTTVGYGDVYPISAGGRTFTYFVLLIGLGVITIPAGLIASALSEARDIEKNKTKNPNSIDDDEQNTKNSKSSKKYS